MTGTERQLDVKFLLGGIALLITGLIFLGDSFGLYSLHYLLVSESGTGLTMFRGT